MDADDDPIPGAALNEGSDLVLRELATGKERVYKNVVDYFFNAQGQKLLMRLSKAPRDSNAANSVVLLDLPSSKLDTIIKGGSDFKSFSLTEDGSRVAFVADRDTNTKALQKFYQLYLYQSGKDSATALVNRWTPGMDPGNTVSENATITWSKSNRRLIFGTAPITPPKDTTLIDIDLVKVDVWNYKDDYLQTQQLNQLTQELRRSYVAVWDFTQNKMMQLGSKGLPTVISTGEGDGKYFFALTDTGRRVASQWSGQTLKDIYAVDMQTGKRILIKKNQDGQPYASAAGTRLALYDNKTKQYTAWDGNGLKTITSSIAVPLYNEENDVPDDPNPYGVMGWHDNDSYVYIYDRYDVWKVDPDGKQKPVKITDGRNSKTILRYVRMNPDEKFFTDGQELNFRAQRQLSKEIGWKRGTLTASGVHFTDSAFSRGSNINVLARAKNEPVYMTTSETFAQSPDLYVYDLGAVKMGTPGPSAAVTIRPSKISSLNPQQAGYNWGTSELVKWKTFDGKPAEGILYKPEDFDSTKKYPMIVYFYEKLTDGLYGYIAPSPTPSRLNIPFFVSKGYLVFTPDISYTKGHPGKDAYNYIVSGSQSLAKRSWVDAKNIAIQGQSWGGYQVAYLITATDMFKAAWAGAPVVNMFSAYGGIRWESGNNRQSQYEKGQSRIGYTPWQRPDLYIENSPLFHLEKVKTPLVIMSNDADGAVPWYQGIEFFTAMRRLNKKVWLLNYNGEAHNLVERRNRKDIQIREQQYFDWMLKGAKPPVWITEGVPATQKGKNWGLEVVETPATTNTTSSGTSGN